MSDNFHTYEWRLVDLHFRFDAKTGFFLNGNPLKLKGVCCHQDHAGVGVAVAPALQEWRVSRLKDLGANAIRTSHNPPDPALLDENFNGKIARGLRARKPNVDMIRVQDTELFGADDPTVLEWAARKGRVLLTHDLDTMTKFANDRIAQGLPMAGVIFVCDTVPVGKVIADLLAVLGASEASEWENRTDFLPL